jgi:hypothetical protein
MHDGAGASSGDAGVRRPPAVAGVQAAGEGGEQLAGEGGVVGSSVAQPVGQREHPLAQGHGWDHVVDEVLGELRHPLAAAGGAEAPAFARKGDQAVEAAGAAVHSGEAVGEDAAFEERS